MSQLLVMPLNRAIVTATFKAPAYLAYYKVPHFGIDMYGDATVFACGIGTVLCAGHDSVVGNTVVIRYDNVWDGAKARSVAVRCFHLASVNVKAGQKVTKDTKIGMVGATGLYVNGAHLHIEIDSDADHWQGIPMLTPAKSTYFYRGGDTMLNPATLLHPYSGDKQSVSYADSTHNGIRYAIKAGFTATKALTYTPPAAVDYKAKYEAEAKAHAATKEQLKASESQRTSDAAALVHCFSNSYIIKDFIVFGREIRKRVNIVV